MNVDINSIVYLKYFIMNDDKKDKKQQQENPDPPPPSRDDITKPININPNPRANENIPEEDRKKGNDEGIGSEITDGEGG
jgi:hypothetical protein